MGLNCASIFNTLLMRGVQIEEGSHGLRLLPVAKMALSFDVFNMVEKTCDRDLLYLRNPNPPQMEVRSVYLYDLETTLVGVGAISSMNARFTFALPYVDGVFFLQSPIWKWCVVLWCSAVESRFDPIHCSQHSRKGKSEGLW